MAKKIKKVLAMCMAISMVMSLLTISVGAAYDGEPEYLCKKAEHTHNASCYGDDGRADCGKNECGEPDHVHSAEEGNDCIPHAHGLEFGCYTLKCGLTEEDYVCGGHVWDAETCPPCTIEEHGHGSDCYEANCQHVCEGACLGCQEVHDHTEECPVASCTHTCGDGCKTLTCEKTEHSHAAGTCNGAGCGAAEADHHVHDAEGADPCSRHGAHVIPEAEGTCYEFICEKTVGECYKHVHDEAICHFHNEGCFEEDCICGLENHAHTIMCKDVYKVKTAAWHDEAQEIADVTLAVPGEKVTLGVDIIYILGRFLSLEEAQADTMISCLKDTISEIVENGTQVNFGIVPFSSTEDPVMPLTTFATEADLATFETQVYAAIQEAGDIYDGMNMENAFVTAKEMFAGSELADYPWRQHLVLVSSGHTYYFNGGEDNEYISTVPVRFILADGTDSDGLFAYPEKPWMRARNNNTNSYPIPYWIVQEYNNNTDKYESVWDCYWHYIDKWATDDAENHPGIVYDLTTRAEGDFIADWLAGGGFVKHSNQSSFSWSGNGAIIKGVSGSALDQYVTIDFRQEGTIWAKSGPNPLKVEAAAHAICNERAMWEAYNTVQEEIVDAGINFYPVYNPLRADGTATNGNYSYYDYTDQYIGHSFMNMLAGGEAVTFSSNKTFFDPIKQEIVNSIASGSYVEDYIGYEKLNESKPNETGYNFDFMVDGTITLKVGDTVYTTAMLDAPLNGATASYTFVAPKIEGATEEPVPTFWLDYYYGNGTTTEKFIWTFGEDIAETAPASLSYQVKLMDKRTVEGEYNVETNIVATLYPEGGYKQDFPVPELKYTVQGGTGETPPSGGGDNPGGETPPSGGGDNPGGETPPSGGGDNPGGGDDLTDIGEGDVPLTSMPDEDVPLGMMPEDDLEDLLDEEVPLAMAPATGDVSAIWMAMSALSGAGLFLTRKKRDEE